MPEVFNLPKKYLVYTAAFLDPAGGKERTEKGKARSGIVVVSGDAADRYYVRYAWAQRCSTQRLYEQIWMVNAKFRPNIFGIEGNAQQGLFVDSVQMEAEKLGCKAPITKIEHPTTLNKDFRIRSILQVPVVQGRLFLCEEGEGMEELTQEIRNFPMSSTKDLIDALASAVDLIPPHETGKQVHEDDRERLRYLRESGAPMSYIQKEAERSYRQHRQPKSLQEYVAMLRGED